MLDLGAHVGDADHDQAGLAGVELLARSATVDRVIDAIKPFNPTVIQTNLTKDGKRTGRGARRGLQG